jgi:hypothetical protein
VQKDKGFEKVFAAIKEYKTSEEARSRVSLKEETAESKAAAEAKAKEAEKDKKLAKADKDKKDDKKAKKADPEADEDGEKLPLNEDFMLQETLRVAADYVQLLNKKPLAKVSLPELEKVTVAEDKKKTDNVKAHP